MPTRRLFAGLVVLLTVGLGGCQAVEEQKGPGTPLHSERGGIGMAAQALESTPVPALEARRSLAVTETAILSQFTLQAVLEQLVAQSGSLGPSGTALFRQLWDTQNPAPGQSDLPGGAHCTDNGNTLNGFPYPCRTSEGAQALSTNPPATMADYQAVGLFNRFDLAPVNGSDCGEYRIVFALTKSGVGRNFIIFEAVLPNPRPDHGLEGCRAVSNFWRDLSTNNDVASRASQLKSFYFTGLPGFAPVVHYAHYGHNSQQAGQVRTNQFMGGPWLLREFKTARTCTSAGCTLRFAPATVKTNPFGDLFSASSTHPLAVEFQGTFFPSQVRALATGNVNTFNYTVPDKFNAGGSDAQSFGPDDYLSRFQGNTALRDRIQTELSAMGSPLTPEQVVARAQALSCGGCHDRSNGANLGGFQFPSSAGFVHSTEFLEPGPEGQRFHLSQALTGTFLPHRLGVLQGFLGKQVDNAVPTGQSLSSTQVQTGQSFTATVTMKNLGTTTWKAADGFSLVPVGHAWGLTSVPLASTDAVAEGQQKSFTFSATAPSTPGDYSFQWRMRHGTALFGDPTQAVTIRVVSDTTLDCSQRTKDTCTASNGCEYTPCCGGMCVDLYQSCPIYCPPPEESM